MPAPVITVKNLPLSSIEIPSFASILFEHAILGILVLDSIGRVVAVNSHFLETTGWTLADVINKPPYPTFDNHIPFKQFFSELLSNGEWHGSTMARISSGEVLPTDIAAYPIAGGGGAMPMHYVLALTKDSDNAAVQSGQDPLTELSNYRAFMRRLGHEVSKVESDASILSLIYMDIDKFSEVIEKNGHLDGDEILRGVADILRNNLPDEGAITRVSADKFAFFVKNIYEQEKLEGLVSSIYGALTEPTAINEKIRNISFSTGVASFPISGDTADELMANAIAACAAVKKAGGGQVCYHKLFEPE